MPHTTNRARLATPTDIAVMDGDLVYVADCPICRTLLNCGDRIIDWNNRVAHASCTYLAGQLP